MSLPNISNIELSLRGIVKGITSTIPKIKVYQDKVPTGTMTLFLILEGIDFLNVPFGIHFSKFKNSDIVLEYSFKIMPLSPLTPGQITSIPINCLRFR